MNLETLGEIIAERKVYVQTQGGNRTEIVVRLGKPQPFPDPPEDFYVPYQILGIGRDKILYAGGVDGIQALQLAILMIGDDLLAIAREHRTTMSWVGRESDPGFPTTVTQ